MDEAVKHQLISAMIALRKMSVLFSPDCEIHFNEIFVLKSIADPSGFNTNELSSVLHISKPAISQILNSLEKRGYISREIDLIDRRKINVSLNEKGVNALVNVKKYHDNIFNEIIARFGEDNTMQLIFLLNRLIEIAEEVRDCSKSRF